MTQLVIHSKNNINKLQEYIWANSKHYPNNPLSIKMATTFDSFTKQIPCSIKWIKQDLHGGVIYLYTDSYNDGDDKKHIYPHYTIPFDDKKLIHYTSEKNKNIYNVSEWPSQDIVHFLSKFFLRNDEELQYYNKYLKYKTKYENLYRQIQKRK